MLSSKLYTLEEYLNLDLDPDKTYELDNGILREMPPESWQNLKIAMYLLTEIIKVIPFERVSQKVEIVSTGSRTRTRVPDLVVLSEEGLTELNMRGQSLITLDMLPPLLVIEVVSPGKESRDRDYRYKRSEYAARGIKHYWIVDPQESKFTSLELKDGLYEEKVYRSSERTVSITQPLKLEVDLRKIFQV